MMKDRSDEVRKIRSSISISELMPSISRFGLSNNSDKDIFPLDSFDSYRLMVVIYCLIKVQIIILFSFFVKNRYVLKEYDAGLAGAAAGHDHGEEDDEGHE